MSENLLKAGHSYDITEFITAMSDKKKIIGLGDNGKCIYRNGYFVCFDVLTTHIYRVQVGINSKYEAEPETKIIEQEEIPHERLLVFCIDNYKTEMLEDEVGKMLLAKNQWMNSKELPELLVSVFGLEKLIKIVVEYDYNNGFENSDTTEFRYDTPLETLIKKVDGGYGITKLPLSVEG